MSISHAKVSGKVDGADATLVQPSDWNGAHTIDDGTLVASKLTAAATKRAFGRNTAGAGNGEEVTASQIFDWVSTTNGVLLTRTAGSWVAAANVAIDNGDLQLANNAAPVTPGSGNKLASMSVGGRQMPVALAAVGANMAIQPLVAQRRVNVAIPQAASTNVQTLGISLTTSGTATSRSMTSTNLQTSSPRIGYLSAAGAGSVAGTRATGQVWRGNATGLGGFHFVCRFAITDAVLVSTANMFVGLESASGAPSDVAPSTLTNILGVGCDNGDTHLQLYAAGSAAQARVDLGANFPVNTVSVDVYELVLFAAPNASSISYQLTRLNTGNVVSGNVSVSANLFSNTTFMFQQIWRSNGGTATAVAIDMYNLYTESDV